MTTDIPDEVIDEMQRKYDEHMTSLGFDAKFRSQWYILDPTGQIPEPAQFYRGVFWFEKNRKLRIVARTPVNGMSVSTVFLGLDHRFGEGPPLVWETMVFGGKIDAEEQTRCSGTRDDAMAMHERMVKYVASYRPFRLPKSKKKRIRAKWLAKKENWRFNEKLSPYIDELPTDPAGPRPEVFAGLPMPGVQREDGQDVSGEPLPPP